jgi:hypothetical protein
VTVCVANIGPRQQRLRLVGGIVMLAATAALMYSLRHASWPGQLLAFPALLTTAVLFLQVQAQTCVALAASGERHLDQRREHVSNTWELATIRTQARQVAVRSVVIAILITSMYVLTV